MTRFNRPEDRVITYPRKVILDCRKRKTTEYYPTQFSPDASHREYLRKGDAFFVEVILPSPNSWYLMRDASGAHDEYHSCYKEFGDGHVEVVCSYYSNGVRACLLEASRV